MQTATWHSQRLTLHKIRWYFTYLPFIGIGFLMALAFAPIERAGFALIALTLLYTALQRGTEKQAFLKGLFSGLGYFGFGISWVYVSIHSYGHLNPVPAAVITFIFIFYLSLFQGGAAYVFKTLSTRYPFINPLLFAAVWTGFEYARATVFGGFPWLLLGFAHTHSPLTPLLPLIGVFGVGFTACLLAGFLSTVLQIKGQKKMLLSIFFPALLLTLPLLSSLQWTTPSQKPLSVGIIQANLSMRDKWDDVLFWQMLTHYQETIETLLDTELIVLPESAIPLPGTYVHDFLEALNTTALKAHSAIVLGMLFSESHDDNHLFNAMISYGNAHGIYKKQQLVPFGEYVPVIFSKIAQWFDVPDAMLQKGAPHQPLLSVQKHPIAALICYELAFSSILRQQLPKAQWIITLSDDGWFGHSLAPYQQRQIAQIRSIETGRYQIFANNDGLSSVIDTKGNIRSTLPNHQAGVLKVSIYPATGQTPWVFFGDTPILIFSCLIIGVSLIYRRRFSQLTTFPYC